MSQVHILYMYIAQSTNQGWYASQTHKETNDVDRVRGEGIKGYYNGTKIFSFGTVQMEYTFSLIC